RPRSKSTLNTRLHTMGHFSFTGRIISPNPAFDLFYTYDRKQWGFVLFKAFDLYDHTTSNNFMLAMLRKNFKISNRLTITPQVGMILEQSQTFADKGTDIASIIITSYKVSSHLTVDHTAIFGNLVLVPEERDWFNRVRFLYSQHHWDVTLSLWHNNKWIDHDNSQYFSSGLYLYYNRVKINDHLLLGAGVSGLVMPYSTLESTYPKRNGVFFTVVGYFH
ncbi:MAG TPA: hypothetical protein VKQ08_09780, partial [Cyclobacteriaceae bacterium]|nr:hypothetical protein [Cyclobacteriaceae bacterium]